MTVSYSTHDVLHFSSPLKEFFHPKSIALVGASERTGSVGRTTFENLLTGGFQGPIYAVNSARTSILGQKCYSRITDLPESIDLVVITTPAQVVPEIIDDCLAHGVPSAIIISAGFKETGAQGLALEQRILNQARHRLRIIGPNCLGLMNPLLGLNATFSKGIAKPGKVALISQSGALCTAILDWSLKQSFGFSGFVSTGSMADVHWGDLIDHFGADPQTQSILIYMESIVNPRAFLSAAKEVTQSKPIIVIKAGRTAAAAQAAASHTGSLTGKDAVLDIAFERAGVIRVNTLAELFVLAETLGKQPLPQGPRLTLVTNAGGPGVLATDALVLGGGTLAPLSETMIESFNHILPSAWSHQNPIDILGDATPERYAQTLQQALSNTQSDAVLVITTPQGMTDPLEVAQTLLPVSKKFSQPILTAWMGGEDVQKARDTLSQGGIPCFEFPDQAAQAFNSLWKYKDQLNRLSETPTPFHGIQPPLRQQVDNIIQEHRLKNQLILSEYQSKKLLKAYGIPVVPTQIATNEEEAVTLAQHFGFPVVMKLHSEIITHKSDVGGVALNLQSETMVRERFLQMKHHISKQHPNAFLGVSLQPMMQHLGYELILGSSQDPQFGPVLLFGAGGQLVEVLKDHALALPPINTKWARFTMKKTKIYQALQGTRGKLSAPLEQLDALFVRLGELVLDFPEIAELDINPLIATENAFFALDARILLYPQNHPLPRPAVRSYPFLHEKNIILKNNEKIFMRPIKAEDEQALTHFHQHLSEQVVYSRYLRSFPLPDRVAHERLARLCQADYDRMFSLVALDEHSKIVGVARLKKTLDQTQGELFLMIADSHQKLGLGSTMIKELLLFAKNEKLHSIFAFFFDDNSAMKKIFNHLHFEFQTQPDKLPKQLKAQFYF